MPGDCLFENRCAQRRVAVSGRGAWPRAAVWRAGVHPPPHQPSPTGSASATPPQGGSDWQKEVPLLRLLLKGGVICGLHKALQYHSPLEGESARGRSPQSSRRGANATSRESISAVRQAAPQPFVPLGGPSCPLVDRLFWKTRAGVHPPPHQPSPTGSASATPPQGGSDWQWKSRRLRPPRGECCNGGPAAAATPPQGGSDWPMEVPPLLRLPLKGGVIGQWRSRRCCDSPSRGE